MEIRPLHPQLHPAQPTTKLYVKLPGTVPFEPIQVIYLQGNGNYTYIQFRDGRKILISLTLQQVAQHLPELIRVHKSYAIAPAGISYMRWHRQANGRRVIMVTMSNLAHIIVSHHRAERLSTDLAQQAGMVISG